MRDLRHSLKRKWITESPCYSWCTPTTNNGDGGDGEDEDETETVLFVHQLQPLKAQK